MKRYCFYQFIVRIFVSTGRIIFYHVSIIESIQLNMTRLKEMMGDLIALQRELDKTEFIQHLKFLTIKYSQTVKTF